MNTTMSSIVGCSEFERQSRFSRMCNSIRTRYSIATAVLLLTALAILYAGGRVVLVHLVRDAEQQVKDIGADISRIAYRSSERVRRAALAVAPDAAADAAALGRVVTAKDSAFALAAAFSADGRLVAGARRGAEDAAVPLTAEDLAPYADVLRNWCAATRRAPAQGGATGIVNVRGAFYYAAMVRAAGEGCLLLGTPFDSHAFSAQVNEGFTGFDVRITNRRADVAVSTMRPPASVAPSSARSGFGIAPMLSEAVNFYTGGFWELGANSFEAVYAIRDIAGNAVSMVAVSIPKTFSSVTQTAVGRLAFFVAVVGILLVLPIFWFQSRVLLNPLTRMTQKVAEVGAHHADTDCPRLDWHGKDEFALLAVSVNRMLETISARALAVAQSEASQRALLASLPDALLVFDRRHRLVSVRKDSAGAAALPFDVPGQRIPDVIFGAEGREKVESALDEAFHLGKASGPVYVKTKHASWVPADAPARHYEIRAVKMNDLFALALLRDVSEEVAEHRQLAEAKEKLREHDKHRSLALFAAGIAHDVNNVFTLIANTTAFAWDDAVDPKTRQAVLTIGDALQRGGVMMRELMDYAGESRLQFARLSPKRIVADAEKVMRGLLGPTVALAIDVPEDLPDVDAAPNQFWKVFMNLVKNAGEAIGSRPGEIRIAARAHDMAEQDLPRYRTAPTLQPGAGVLFTVADDGPGIRPDLLAKIFDPYVSSKSLGRGLGLATVCSTVLAHGGAIRVESVVDRGTTFSVFLPVSKLPKPAEHFPDRAAPQAPAAEGGEVLVVDDEEGILKTTAMLLKVLKKTAYLAKDADTALAEFRRRAATLSAVILDAALGKVDTVRLAQAFRATAPRVPIVIASGSSEEKIRTLFAGVKIDAFLAKPYTLSELKHVLGA